MITSLQLADFKNFRDESLHLGPFTVVVGANASGKSNIRDAFRFLHGIGRGYGLADIVGGKYGAGGQVEWDPIRGTAEELVRLGERQFQMAVEMGVDTEQDVRYAICVSCDLERDGSFQVISEELALSKVVAKTFAGEELSSFWMNPVYTSHPADPDPVRQQNEQGSMLLRMGKTGNQRKYGARVAVRSDQPALGQIGEHDKLVRSHKETSRKALNTLENMRFLDLSPNSMRRGAFPGQTVLGDRGDNLATVLKKICEDVKRREALVEWTRELTPMDVVDFEFPNEPTTGRIHLVIREANSRAISAYAASDGTLRFLAMLAALLGDNPAGLYFFEEIDNGIHPSRLRLLVDLIEERTSRGDVQVITTTHSPELLSMIGDETFGNTSVVCRSPETDDAVVRPIGQLAKAGELRRTQGLGRLLGSGWLEDAIFFQEIDDVADSR